MWYFLLGCVTISISGLSIDLLLKALYDREITIRNISRKNRTNMQLTISNKRYKDFIDIANKHNAETKVIRRQGILFRFFSFISRPVLCVGFVVILILSIMGNWFIIELKYNINADEETKNELIETCKGLGIYQGAYKKNWDIDELELEIYKSMSDIVFISIIIDGSFVEIIAVEKSISETGHKRNEPADVIAGKSCVIQKILLYNGHSLVKVGDVVSKGQLLVSGVLPYKNDEKSTLVGASADITGSVWYTGIHHENTYDEIRQKTNKTQKSIQVIFGDKIILTSKVKLLEYDTTAYEYEMMKGIWPIKLIIYENTEVKIENIIIDIDEAIHIAESRAIEKARIQIDNSAIIINITVNSIINNDTITAQATIETNELISVHVLMNDKE